MNLPAVMLNLILLCMFTTTVRAVVADEHVDITALLKRIETLEARDASQKAELATLKSAFGSEVNALKSDIADIRSKCNHTMDALTKPSIGSKRAIAQTQVAFSAIAPDHDFSAMSANQKLIYATPFTNVGNAFHSSTGTVIAPVKGTYVVFATVGGNIHSSNYFYIDVNGSVMAKVLLASTTANQSSNMVVVTLKPGDEVSVKSGRDHDGAYGGYFTTISGFLLYETQHTFPIGK